MSTELGEIEHGGSHPRGRIYAPKEIPSGDKWGMHPPLFVKCGLLPAEGTLFATLDYVSCLKRLMVLLRASLSGVFLGRLLPDFLRFAALPRDPQHFAQVRRNFRVGPRAIGLAQVFQRLFVLAQPIQHPAHAVDDKRVVGRSCSAFSIN